MTEFEDREAAKEAIYHALNSDYCVLEFDRMDDGTINIADLTEHVRQLERLHNNNDPAEPIDK